MAKKLSSSKRKDIVAQLKQGKSLRSIAMYFKIGSSTVRRIGIENNILSTNKAGCKKKLTDRDERFCVKKIISGEEKSVVALTKTLKKDKQISVGRNTIARALNKAGLKAGEKKKKPLLSAKNINARMEFAKKHKDWTIEDWKRVIFSDESKINRFNSDGRSWCWFRDVGELETRTVDQTPKFGGGGVMVWGCVTWEGVGYLCKIDGNMDQHLYKNILEDDLMETIQFYALDPSKIVFQHDNDPKHKAKIVQEWLANQEFETMEWPAQSPDLNLIEHMWAEVKRRLNKFDTPSKGVFELWERVQKIWNEISPDVCMNLYESMPRRMEAVLKAKGKWTKY